MCGLPTIATPRFPRRSTSRTSAHVRALALVALAPVDELGARAHERAHRAVRSLAQAHRLRGGEHLVIRHVRVRPPPPEQRGALREAQTALTAVIIEYERFAASKPGNATLVVPQLGFDKTRGRVAGRNCPGFSLRKDSSGRLVLDGASRRTLLSCSARLLVSYTPLARSA